MLRFKQIKIREDIPEKEVFNLICKKYNLDKSIIVSWHIFKKSIDARDKNDIHYSYSVDIEFEIEKEQIIFNKIKNKKNVEIVEKPELKQIEVMRKSKFKPVIIGAGPARVICCTNTG